MKVSGLDRWMRNASIFCILCFALQVAGSLVADNASGAVKNSAVTVQTLAAVFVLVSLLAVIVMGQVEKFREGSS